MIEWFDFGVGILFLVIGIFFLIRELIDHCEGESVNVLVSWLVFIIGIVLIGISLGALDEPFNSSIHECTEWGCIDNELFLAQDNNGDWYCGSDEGVATSHMTGEKEPISKCVSFRDKTSEEREADYCKMNATDSDRCSCLQYEVLPSLPPLGGYSIEEINYRLSWGWLDRYGTEHFAGKIVNRSEVTWQDNRPLYKWDVSNPDGSGFGTSQPVKCVSAVPISDKIYCDENPTDTERCDCVVRTCAGIPIEPRIMILNNTDLQCHVYDWKDKELKSEIAKIPTTCVGAVPKVTR